jgi:hypothetical protein
LSAGNTSIIEKGSKGHRKKHMAAESFYKAFVAVWNAAIVSGEIHDGEPFEDKAA